MIRFVVPGPPVSKARPRVVRGHTYTPEKTRRFERLVGMCARTAGARPIAGEVSVSISFYLPTKRRVDLDNLSKGVLDGLNKIAWADDSQVSTLFATRQLDRANPRAVIEIQEVGDGPVS